MKVSRTSKLDSVYQREVASILNGSLKNQCPTLSGIISVTSASVAPDLKNARIFISIYAKDDKSKAETFQIIRENAGFVRHELAKVMRMRTVPNLQFVLDASLEYGAHMEELFAKIHKDVEETDGADGTETDEEK